MVDNVSSDAGVSERGKLLMLVRLCTMPVEQNAPVINRWLCWTVFPFADLAPANDVNASLVKACSFLCSCSVPWRIKVAEGGVWTQNCIHSSVKSEERHWASSWLSDQAVSSALLCLQDVLSQPKQRWRSPLPGTHILISTGRAFCGLTADVGLSTGCLGEPGI